MASPKTILITGCSAGGVGAALALALAKRGHHVFATARNPSKIPAELSSLSVVTTLALDVSSGDSIVAAAQAVAKATEEKGARGLDILVNNAGIGYTLPLLDVDIDVAKEVFDANFWGPLRMVQAFTDLLSEKRGKVLNVSSIGSLVNVPWIGIYSASKAALNSISDTLRVELAPFGIKVTTLMLGTVTTNFPDNRITADELPPDSRYILIKDIIARWVSGEDVPKGCSPDEIGEILAGDLVANRSPDHLWRAPQSTFGWIMSRFVPWWLIDTMVSQHGLTELSKRMAQQAADKTTAAA